MAIDQISTSNTFSQWLGATQGLIDKSNYYEDTTNAVFNQANVVISLSSDVNAKSLLINTQTTYANTLSASINNVSNLVNSQTATVLATSDSIRLYVNTAYSTTNTAYLSINAAYVYANAAYGFLNSAYTKSNAAYLSINAAYLVANAAYPTINAAYLTTNSAFLLANTANTSANLALSTANIALTTANAVLSYVTNVEVSTIIDNNTIDANYYIILSQNSSGTLVKTNVASQKLSFNPSLGKLYANQVNTTAVFTSNTSLVNNLNADYLDGNHGSYYAPLAGPTFTGTVTLPSTTSIGLVSSTELGYLDGVTSAIQTQLGTKAPLAGPTFTGTVVLPSTTSIGLVSSTELGYLDGVTSAIQTQLGTKAALASPTFTGVPLSPTAASDTSNTMIATTGFVTGQASVTSPNMDGVAAIGTSIKFARADHIHPSDTSRAPLSGPTFTGTVTLPSTTSIGTVSSTELGYLDGTTSAIQTQLDSKAPLTGATFTGTITLPSTTSIGLVSSTELGYLDGVTGSVQTQLDSKATLSSPSFTGTPQSTTAAVDTSNTMIATTGFVTGQASAVTPIMDGTGTVGSSTRFARADHIHPSDTSRASLASPTFTGTVTLPSTTSIGTVSSTELGYLDGVTGSVQTQLNSTIFTAGVVAKSAAYTVVAADRGKTFNCTGTFTLTLTEAATLADGFAFSVVNSGTGTITIDPNSSETIDGAITLALDTGQSCIVACNGSSFVTVGKEGGGSSAQIQTIAASVASNALTLTLNPTSLDFRSTTLTSGAINTRTVGSAISVIVPSGATLGSINAVASRLVILAIDNAGTVELAVTNLKSCPNLDETTLISTTAISTAADNTGVIYSTTARTNLPFRVVGFIDITEATAGTWATAPKLVQGCGGQALIMMSSVGYGQTWQSVSRSSGTTYYNTTGKPIMITNVAEGSEEEAAIMVDGTIIVSDRHVDGNDTSGVCAMIPPGSSYKAYGTTTYELR